MGKALQRRIQQTKFESPIQEAMLNLMVAANDVRQRAEQAAAPFGITLPQYNVLRILRGAHPDGHPRREIAARMLDRAPDVTRIVDRLEEKRLVQRDRETDDRRHSVARITKQGLRLLDQMEPAMRAAFEDLRGRLTAKEARELSRLCEALYES